MSTQSEQPDLTEPAQLSQAEKIAICRERMRKIEETTPKREGRGPHADIYWICKKHQKICLDEDDTCDDDINPCSKLEDIYGFDEEQKDSGWACWTCFYQCDGTPDYPNLLVLNPPYQTHCQNWEKCEFSRKVKDVTLQVRQLDEGVYYTWTCLLCLRDGRGTSHNDVARGPKYCIANENGMRCPVTLEECHWKEFIMPIQSSDVQVRAHFRETATSKHPRAR